MLKYAVKEDYENSKSEIKLLPITLEFVKPNREKEQKAKEANFKALQKRMYKKKKVAKKGKLGAQQRYEDSSVSEEDDADKKEPEDDSEDEGTPG